ncbi:multicopper oxidase domain-containing protein [Cohnella terricola]|uniref:Copper oxidase n=1 Tax=Cohnella terricola TaxID=1289167 RepID=A0A559JU13_9BACL|nr:multicopper oxidase domain-containing protein [Cohnella terricola]TVY03310.1 hypothetical protein FPZ45_05405 [Cohnella terricola]
MIIINRLFSRGILLFAAAILFLSNIGPVRGAIAASPAVKQFRLYATDGYLTLPDGKQVYIWGYSLKNEPGSAEYPSPTLEVNEGDRVEITLTNIGPSNKAIKKLAHTIHWHGLDTDQSNDGVPHTSPAIQLGESFTYKFTADHAGTYFYHCHVDTVEHLQMGMFGAFIVKAKNGANQAWTGGPAFDKDYAFVVNEIDPVWHQAVEESKPYDRTAFHPVYWTINGKSYPDTEQDATTMIEGRVGQTVLIRIINAGYEPHSFHLHGFHFDVIASDGRPLPQPISKDTVLIGQGERYDLLVKFDKDGMFPLHSHNIVDNTNNGVYPGGLHTMVNVKKDSEIAQKKTIVLRAELRSAVVDGAPVTLQQTVASIRGYYYIPLRFIAEQWNADLTWDQRDESAVIVTDQASFQLWMNSKQAKAGGKLINLAAPPVRMGDTVMVPVRFVSEQLGADLSYDRTRGEIKLTATLHSRDLVSSDSGTPHDHGTPSETGNAGTAPDHVMAPLTVEIQSNAFMPGILTVKKGQIVTWINKDTSYHTVYELNDLFRSKNLYQNDRFSYTFTEVGTYEYYCSIHPVMQAKISVIE